MIPTSSNQVTTALGLTFWEQSPYCFEAVRFSDAGSGAFITGSDTQMSCHWLMLGADRRVTTVVVAVVPTVVMRGPITSALQRATWWHMSPTSGDQVASSLRATLWEQDLHCPETLSFQHALGRASVACSDAQMDGHLLVAGAHWRVCATVVARLPAVEVSSPVAAALY